MNTIKPTKEQLDNTKKVNSLVAGQALLVQASAGCAKTTTLVQMASSNTEHTLVLVYNKASQLDCVEKFKGMDHVNVKTTHGLAYQHYGSTMTHKLRRPQGAYKNVAGTGGEIATKYRISPIEGDKLMTAPYLGLLAKRALGTFETSDYKDLDEIKLGYLDGIAVEYGVESSKLKGVIKKVIKELWRDRTNLGSDVLCTHDTYLKLFQLSKPDLGYDRVYLDEAQDSTPAVIDIVKSQQKSGAKVCIVGDPRQQLYAWRGAVDALDKFDNFIKGTLSETFRYGQDSADLAGAILNDGTKITSAKGLVTKVGQGVVDRTKPYTILYRSNIGLIFDAIDSLDAGHKIALEIDVQDFCRMLESCYQLQQGNIRKVKHEEILAYSNWKEFTIEAQSNPELSRMVQIIKSGRMRSVIKTLNNMPNTNNPDITFTTAHKSKGREWDQVVLGDDYPAVRNKDGSYRELSYSEANLLYVACTRAKVALGVNETVLDIKYFAENPEEDDCIHTLGEIEYELQED